MFALLLLFQATRFLQPAPAPDAVLLEGEADYRSKLESVALSGELVREQLDGLRPATTAEQQVVLHLLLSGDPAQRRLAVLVSAGAPEGSLQEAALLRLAAMSNDPAEQLGALLAPEAIAPANWPAVAWMALDAEVEMAVRAAAMGRLLEADCPGAWPIARSMLRTGTRLDEDAPWATWERTGRYELAKRTLMVSVDRWLRAHGIEPPAFEANAAWIVQEQQLVTLEGAARRARAGVAPSTDPGLERGLERLFQAARSGEERALDVLAMLHPHSAERTGALLRSGDLEWGAVARAVIDRLPQ